MHSGQEGWRVDDHILQCQLRKQCVLVALETMHCWTCAGALDFICLESQHAPGATIWPISYLSKLTRIASVAGALEDVCLESQLAAGRSRGRMRHSAVSGKAGGAAAAGAAAAVGQPAGLDRHAALHVPAPRAAGDTSPIVQFQFQFQTASWSVHYGVATICWVGPPRSCSCSSRWCCW